jgi:uncharacterized membrane protein YedE/YeeE
VNITVKVFGRDKANLVFGWVFAGHQLGAATAAMGAGLTRTELATYLPALMAAGALCIVAAGMTLRLTPLRAITRCRKLHRCRRITRAHVRNVAAQHCCWRP